MPGRGFEPLPSERMERLRAFLGESVPHLARAEAERRAS